MNVLIIGGTRFLGAAVARELVARANSVTVFHRGQTAADLPESVSHVLGDARDKALVEQTLASGGFGAVVDTILNADDLAWYLPMLERRTGRLVHCGSTGVYAPMESVPVREDDPRGQGGLTRDPEGQGTYSESGVWGDATLATVEKGRIVVEATVEGILKDIEELREAAMPAPEAAGSGAHVPG